ncbi:MAG: ribbon-helix-helix domain-containing protein [Candidatus Jacksonbacteria bacterium]
MQTLNISVTKNQFNLVNQLMAEWGFANRSEFFRALLRALVKPEIFSTPIHFQAPPIRSAGKVMDGFRKTGKYNQKFLDSLEKGLTKSAYFNS